MRIIRQFYKKTETIAHNDTPYFISFDYNMQISYKE